MADNNSYVIQIENNTNKSEDVIISKSDNLVPTNFEHTMQSNLSRNTSTSSQQSLNSSELASTFSICCNSPVNYDSGNFSVSDINSSLSLHRPASMSSADDKSVTYPTSSSNCYKELREKRQILFLAIQDVRRLKSELDRLNKSEKWYKNELKIQKRSRLEILEKLYLNERNYYRENQKLQTECKKLYELIGDITKKADQDKEHLLKQMQIKDIQQQQDIVMNNGKCETTTLPSKNFEFEIQKLLGIIQEHEQLINILRRQKQSLLNDLRNLTVEKDTKIILLEKNVANLDEENRKIIEKCKKMILEKSQVENKLKQLSIIDSKTHSSNIKIIESNSRNEENIQNMDKSQNELVFLNENYQSFLMESSEKFQKLSVDDMQRNQIDNLKSSYPYPNLQDDQQQLRKYQLENLSFKFQEKSFEIDNFKSFNLAETEQISKLQIELDEYRNVHENYQNSIQINEDNLKNKILMVNELQYLMENQKTEIKLIQQENDEIKIENEKLLNSLQIVKKDLENHSIDLNHSNKELLSLKNIIETQKEEISLMLREKNNFENSQMKYENISRILDEKTIQLVQQNSDLEELKLENRKIKEKMPKEIKSLKLQLENQNSEIKKLMMSNKELEDFIKYHKLNFEKEELNKHQIFEQLCGDIRTIQTELQICNLDNEKMKTEIVAKNTSLENLKTFFEQQNQLIRKFNATSLVEETFYNNESFEINLEIKKVLQNKEENEWEYLVKNFNHNQLIINKTANILNHKSSEIVKLTNLLVDYKRELEQLHRETDLLYKEKSETFENVRKLEDNLKIKIIENDNMQLQIKSLETTNNNLVKLEENFENQPFVKNQQFDEKTNEITKLTEKLYKFTENNNNNFNEYKIKNMENEKIENDMKIEKIENFDKVKSNYCTNCESFQQEKHIFLKNKEILYDNFECNMSNTCLNSSPANNDINSITEELKQIKLLKSVIEIEHKKKMSRYEVHISTLLTNIKNYKKEIDILESQYSKLLIKYETLKKCSQDKSEKLIANKYDEITEKYVESVKTLNVYKNQLETAQNHLKNIDIYNHLNTNPKCRLTNLMDDYKTLIHPLVSVNGNRDFSLIYDLIDKSNNYMPNLNCLSVSVNDIKCDIENLKSNFFLNSRNSTVSPINFLPPSMMLYKPKSLMDEFKEISLNAKI